MVFFIFSLLVIVHLAQGLDLDDFYAFGKERGDARLRNGTGTISRRIDLSATVHFFGEVHRRLYVNLNGVISFDQPASTFSKYAASRNTKGFPAHQKIIAPFYADIDTRKSGEVIFRETQEETLLIRATTEVRARFTNEKRFKASNLFIVTWLKVRYDDQKKAKTTTFQVVLASDKNRTFVFFHYENLGIRGKIGVLSFPEAGFSAGDQLREVHLPGSGTNKVYLLNKLSNVNQPGKWIYLLGSRQKLAQDVKTAGSDVQGRKHEKTQHLIGDKGCYLFHNLTSYDIYPRPAIKTAYGCNMACSRAGFPFALFHHADGCMCAEDTIWGASYRRWNMEECKGENLFTVYKTSDVMMGDEATHGNSTDTKRCGGCGENALCGFSEYCCVCKDGYHGNGKSCLADGESSQMVGTLTGKINDIDIKNISFSVYADSETTTTYLSLSPTPPKIGWLLRVMMPMVATSGFMFARANGSARNGFDILGSRFLRRGKVTFETGEKCYFREQLMGRGENRHFNFKVELTGSLPKFDENYPIDFDDYLHSFRHDRRGMVTGYYRSSFTVGQRKHDMSVVELFEFPEVEGCLNMGKSKMEVSELRSQFDKEGEIVRFSMKTEMRDTGVKLCGKKKRRCHRHAQCIKKGGVEFCSCNIGFTGDGFVCTDVDECYLKIDECSPYADCVNTAGSFTCTCRENYQGDGKICRDGLCGKERKKCGPHSKCVALKTGVESCECDIGFTMKGSLCEDVDECALDIDNCSYNADCANVVGSYKCVCRKGYVGDGITCRIGGVGSGDGCSPEGRQCGENAKCLKGICRCVSGFFPDGLECEDANECELGIHTCDRNAVCVNTLGSFKCNCNEGYSGDGYKCVFQEPKLEGCNGATCDDNAECKGTGKAAVCTCKTGYLGNGLSCIDANECELGIHTCNRNAVCANTLGSFKCTCNDGYSGDGYKCVLEGPKQGGCNGTKCHDNAECKGTGKTAMCTCKTGYHGNGLSCEDVDECALNYDECHKNGLCSNTPGSYDCRCKPGYVGNGFQCDYVNPCKAHECGPHAKCIARGGSPTCECDVGYYRNGERCTDVDECAVNYDECHKNGLCSNTLGSYDCRCKPGYVGNGFQCDHVDPCKAHKCGSHAKCVARSGSPTCECDVGYYRNGKICTDVNECAANFHECHKNGLCSNTPGSYYCSCKPGYVGNGFQCDYIDPCKAYKCDPYATCIVKDGSPTCQCNVGYHGNGKNCRDINECDENRHKCDTNARCLNNPGSYSCRCRAGYIGDGFSCDYDDPCKNLKCDRHAKCIEKPDGSPTCQCNSGFYGTGKICQDFDECKSDRKKCDSKARCINTVGSFKCFCSRGYVGDGFTCQSDGSCGGSKCHENARCSEINATKSCQCNTGFVGNGLVCSDFDECKEPAVQCPRSSRCVNTFGSYKCRCNAGYQWDGKKCQSVCLRCLNGGTCIERGCLCRQGYSGDRCQWTGDEFLMFSQGSTIQRTSLPPRQDTVGILLDVPGGLIVALDFDHKNKFIYFTDVAGKALWRVRYNGTGAEKVVTSGLSSPEGIAVDYVAGNIYWTDSMFDRVEVARLDGSNRKVLFTKRLINPRSIVVHPERGTMYWADWNRASPKIEMAHMDGSSRHVFMHQKMGLPNGLTIDRRNEELCWSDAKHGTISCANLDEGKPEVVYSAARYPFGLTSFGLYMIWTDWSTRSIQQYDKQTFKLLPPIKRIKGSHGTMYDIKTVQQPPEIDDHQCMVNNGGCSNLCLPKPGGKSCACPTGFRLVDRDEKPGGVPGDKSSEYALGSGEDPGNTTSITGSELGMGATPSHNSNPTPNSVSGSGSGSGDDSRKPSGPGALSSQGTNSTRAQITEKVCVKDGKYEVLRSLQ